MLPLLHGLRLHFHGLRFCALRSVPSELQLNTDSRTARTQIHSIVLGAFPRTFLEQHPLITLPVPACFTTHSPLRQQVCACIFRDDLPLRYLNSAEVSHCSCIARERRRRSGSCARRLTAHHAPKEKQKQIAQQNVYPLVYLVFRFRFAAEDLIFGARLCHVISKA